MALPPLHFIVGAACAEVARPESFSAPRAWLIGGLIGIAPDVPSALSLFLGDGAPDHGLYTHTLIAVAVAGAVGWLLGGSRWGIIAAAAYGSHLLFDLLREAERTSVYLLGPFVPESQSAILHILPHIPFDIGGGGSLITLYGHEPLVSLIVQTAYGLIPFGAAVLFRRVRRRKRTQKPWREVGDNAHEMRER